MGRNRIIEDELFTVTDNEIRWRLINILHKIIADKNNFDNLNLARVQLISNDDQIFSIEKVYLLENCPVLGPELNDSTNVKLDTCNGEVLEQLINFIRTGETTLNLMNLAMMSNTCEKFGLHYLKTKCTELRKIITKKPNWTDMLKIAVEAHDMEFQDIIFIFLKKSYPNFYEAEQFLSLNFNEIKCMLQWPKRLFENFDEATCVLDKWHNSDSQKRLEFCELVVISHKEFNAKAKAIVTASVEQDKPPLKPRINMKNIINTPTKGIKRGRDSDVGQENDQNKTVQLKEKISKKLSINSNKKPKLQKTERARSKLNEHPLHSSQIIFSFKDMTKKGTDIISLDIDTKKCHTFKSTLPRSMQDSKVIIGNDRVYKIDGYQYRSKNKEESNKIKSFSISQFLKPSNYKPRIEWRDDGQLSSERTDFEAIIARQNLYIICGNTNLGKCASPEIEKFDLKQKKTLDVLKNTDDDDVIDDAKFILKYYRENFGVALLDDKIYIVGGKGAKVNDDEDDDKKLSRQVLDSVEVFDINTEISQELPNMSTKRVDHMVVSAYGKIFALGGRTENSLTSSALKSIEIYHPEWGQWTEGKSMITKRASGSAFLYEDCIWVVGGNKEGHQTVEKFDPNAGLDNSGEWKIVCKLPYNHQKVEMSTCALIKDNIV